MNSFRKGIKRLWQTQAMGIFLVIIILSVIVTLKNPFYLTTGNVFSLMTDFSIIAIIAVGMTMVILTGGIDISVGSILSLSSCIVGSLLVAGHGNFLSMVVALLIAGGVGLFNGLLITKVNIPPIIVTLGTMSLARGAVLVFTGGYYITNIPDRFSFLGQGKLFDIPIPVIIMFIIFVIFSIILKRTPLGRRIYAVGGNEEAVRLSGVNTDKIKIFIYVVTGFLAGISGLIMTSRLSSAQPNSGMGYELQVIAAVIIGGTSLVGGKGNVWGSLMGAALLGVINNALIFLNISVFWTRVIIGTIIVLAVYLDRVRTQGRKQSTMRIREKNQEQGGNAGAV